MTGTPQEIRQVAEELFISAPPGVDGSNAKIDVAVWACGKLRGPLVRLAGPAAFSSLLSRALAVAKVKSPSLDVLHVDPDGLLSGSGDLNRNQNGHIPPDRPGVILVTELLGLLVVFIGLPLTLTLIEEAWPGTLATRNAIFTSGRLP